jgi:Family of unknown function (DUF6496)
MPEQETLRSAREDQQQGKAPSTQAGEFVREEIEHVRRGKHGARSAQQAIAIGLSKARRAGVKLPPPNPGTMSTRTRRKAKLHSRAASKPHKPSRKRSRAIRSALTREKRRAASSRSLSKQARGAANRRTQKNRSAAARKAARTRKRRK